MNLQESIVQIIRKAKELKLPCLLVELSIELADQPSSQEEPFKLDPVWEINIPQPDHVLPTSPTQNVPWAQWMEEIEPWIIRFRDKHHPLHTEPNRFVLE